MIACIIFSLLYLQNLTEEDEIEQLFFESNMDMMQRSELMVLEFDEETQSFPCRKCGHLFYSTEALENHDNTSHGNDKRFSCGNCDKEFRKDQHKLLYKVHC